MRSSRPTKANIHLFSRLWILTKMLKFKYLTLRNIESKKSRKRTRWEIKETLERKAEYKYDKEQMNKLEEALTGGQKRKDNTQVEGRGDVYYEGCLKKVIIKRYFINLF